MYSEFCFMAAHKGYQDGTIAWRNKAGCYWMHWYLDANGEMHYSAEFTCDLDTWLGILIEMARAINFEVINLAA